MHSVFLQCTNKENIEYIPSCEMENLKSEEVEEYDENLAKENEELVRELKTLQKQYELRKEDFAGEEMKNLEGQIIKSKQKSERKEQENIISFISKKETKSFDKIKLFKSFLQHNDDKLQNFDESIKDSLEDLERNINNFKEDFKKVLENQQDLLLIANNDGINNLSVDFKNLYK